MAEIMQFLAVVTKIIMAFTFTGAVASGGMAGWQYTHGSANSAWNYLIGMLISSGSLIFVTGLYILADLGDAIPR